MLSGEWGGSRGAGGGRLYKKWREKDREDAGMELLIPILSPPPPPKERLRCTHRYSSSFSSSSRPPDAVRDGMALGSGCGCRPLSSPGRSCVTECGGVFGCWRVRACVRVRTCVRGRRQRALSCGLLDIDRKRVEGYPPAPPAADCMPACRRARQGMSMLTFGAAPGCGPGRQGFRGPVAAPQCSLPSCQSWRGHAGKKGWGARRAPA